MQMVGEKIFARCIPVPDQTCTYTFWRGGRERAGRKRGRRFRCIRGRVTVGANFFAMHTRPDLHTPIWVWGARKGATNRRSTQGNGRQPSQGVIWRRRSPPARKSSAQGNDAGRADGRAGGSKPINGNPAAGKLLEQAPAVFCHTVDIYSKKTLRAGLILHPPPVTMTSLTPYKVADAVGPDGRRLGGAVGLATYRATRLATYQTTHGFIKRVACYIWEKKRSKGNFILLSGANLG